MHDPACVALPIVRIVEWVFLLKCIWLAHLESKEMQVIRLWRQHAHSSSEVIYVVLPPTSAPLCGVACIHAYLIMPQWAHGAPNHISQLFKRL
jgi:hypothetical protein